MAEFIVWLEAKSWFFRAAFCVAMSLCVALFSIAFKPAVSIGLFYFFPIFFITWLLGFKAGAALSAWSVLLWKIAESSPDQLYGSLLVGYRDGVIRFCFFVSIAYLGKRLKTAQEQHRDLARTDPLTRIANRLAFMEAMERESQHAPRGEYPVTMAYIDLDNFKLVNDKMGHSSGDELLRTVAQILKTSVRVTDTAARLGGDEFGILLPMTNTDGTGVLLERIRVRLRKGMEFHGWPVTFSIGAITFSRKFTSNEMLERADALMYQVKRKNKDAVQCELTEGEFFTQGVQTL